MANVSVIIPTFNGLSLLKEHLINVVNILRAHDELIVVDDFSNDQTLDWLISQFNLRKKLKLQIKKYEVWYGRWHKNDKTGHLKVIRNSQNLRFAQAVNLGVRQSSSPYILLLNNDVSPYKNIISILLPHFQNKQVFAVGCLEYESDIFGQKSGKNKLWFERGMFIHDRADEFSFGETAWVSGGSGMFDRSKWLELNGFDPIFDPAYWEDVDLSFRSRQKGWRVLFEPRAVVYHKHESTNLDVFGQEIITATSWNNARKFTNKHANWIQYLLFLVWTPYWWWKMYQYE